MPFLLKIEHIQVGEKRSVKIDIHEVVKIFFVLSGERIHGPVRRGKGIHKGTQAPFQHREKRITHREFFRAAQGSMFQDMRNTG